LQFFLGKIVGKTLISAEDVRKSSAPQPIDFEGVRGGKYFDLYFHAFHTNGQIGHTCVGPQKLRWPIEPRYP